MRSGPSRYTGLSLALAAAVALGACSGKQHNSSTADTTMNSPTNTTSAGGALASPESAAKAGSTSNAVSTSNEHFTDANIVALLDAANKADSSTAAMVLPKLTNSRVKQFAQLMMTSHHGLRVEGQQLARRENIVPQPPSPNPLEPLVKNVTDALQGKTGKDLDSTYIDQEITVHKAVIDLAKKAEDQAQNKQLKALIKQATPVLKGHLDRAEQIQKSFKTTA
jgi:predicted outer membrane protein